MVHSQRLYNSKPQFNKDRKKKKAIQTFSISVHITKRRYLLLINAWGIIKVYNASNFESADFACSS